MNQPIETNNGVTRKQENGETSANVIFVENETLTHVNHTKPESPRGHFLTQNKSNDFLSLTGLENNSLDATNFDTIACGCTSNRAYSASPAETCKPGCNDKDVDKSSDVELYESGASNNCKLVGNGNDESYVKTRATNTSANMDYLLSSFYSFSSSSMMDKDVSQGVNRSHPIIAHILTGEDKNLGKEQSGCSPDRTKSSGHVKKDVTFSMESRENSDKSDTDDVDSFIDEAICKNLMAEKLEVSGEWEIGNRSIESPSKAQSSKQTSDPFSTERRPFCSLVIADGKTGSELKQVISQALTDVSSVKVISPTEALNTCNMEEFHLVWIHILPDLLEEFVSLCTAIRYSSRKNRNSIMIALTDKVNEGEVKLQSFDTVCTLPISKETIQQMYQKQQWILGKEITDSERSMVSPEFARTPESAMSVESIRSSEKSQSSQCESGTGTFELNDVPFMENKNLTSDSKHSAMVDMINTYRKRSSPSDAGSPAWCRAEHANKEKQRSILSRNPVCTEKQRWERIKDSCDQLRVLLPYVRGRKTDMASILEMTVDYLRIITAALPQDFQSQIINIMSSGSSLPACEINKKNKCVKIPTRNISPLIQQTTAEIKNNDRQVPVYPEPESKLRILTRSVSKSLVSPHLDDSLSSGSGNENHIETQTSLCSFKPNQTKIFPDGDHVVKRECPSTVLTEGRSVKRSKVKVLPAFVEPSPSKSICLPTTRISTLRDTKKETFDEMVTHVSTFPSCSLLPKVTDSDMAVSHVYTPSQVGNPDVFQFQQHHHSNNLTSRMASADRDITQYGGVYMDGNYYTYFPLTESSGAGFCIPTMPGNYVSPNAVLPMTSQNSRSGSFSLPPAADQATVHETEPIRVNPATNLFDVSTNSNVGKNNNV